ncbi:transporter substrate-binding domain-containing protein [Butyrivibrio sp. JL13D10]|uniref:transporter substrate-binding domain-containing protein n=1 Tax=Butyrivibrio sp. JL13D10 TaxID=3236815 RepID=UPI0038B6756D
MRRNDVNENEVRVNGFSKNYAKSGVVRKTLVAGTMAAVMGMSLLGCGSASAAGSGKDAASDNNQEVTKVVIGSGINYNPYCYLDENGDAVGYEYDVLAEIDELLPQYEFEYQSMAFDQLVLSLESGKIDVAAHQYEYTPEREEKYLFAGESYTSYITYLAVLADSDVTSLEDLAGQKIRTGGATSATTQILTKYNEEHPGKEVELVTSESSSDEEAAAALKSGAAAASVLKKSDVTKMNKNFSDDGKDWLKSVGEPINNSKTYYLYRKDETELAEAIDGALKTLKENGKLSELAIKWVGYDVTEEE